jgi:hypothetical protein
MVENFTFTVYCNYLAFVAEKNGRPFCLPKRRETLEQRTDYSFFCVLASKLSKNGIKAPYLIKRFFDYSSKKMTSFYVKDFVQCFDEAIVEFQKVKDIDINKVDYFLEIKKSFDNLREYAIIRKIEKFDDLVVGEPPALLKLWKGGKVHEAALVYMLDFKKLKEKAWFKIYCGDLSNKINKISKNIETTVDLASFLEGEQIKFKTIFKE